MLVSGSFFLRGQLRETRARVQNELKAIAALKARELNTWYAERRDDAAQIAQGALIQTQLRRFLSGSPLAPPEADLRDWLEAVQKNAYRRVVLFDGLGRVRLSVPSGKATTDDLDASEVQVALASKAVTIP